MVFQALTNFHNKDWRVITLRQKISREGLNILVMDRERLIAIKEKASRRVAETYRAKAMRTVDEQERIIGEARKGGV